MSSEVFRLDKPCRGIPALSFAAMGSSAWARRSSVLISSVLQRMDLKGPSSLSLSSYRRCSNPFIFLSLSAPVTPHLFCIAVCAAVSGLLRDLEIPLGFQAPPLPLGMPWRVVLLMSHCYICNQHWGAGATVGAHVLMLQPL